MEFYRDVLNGPLYYIAVVVSVILIMAIIGFLMERKKLYKEAIGKIAHVDSNVAPIQDVKVEPKKEVKKTVKPKKAADSTTPAVASTEVPVFTAVETKEVQTENKK